MSAARRDHRPLDSARRDRVLARLGFTAPPAPDLDGLRALYSAWCARVPFDNVRKMIALRAADAGPLPGGHADDFLEAWLEDGAGGTCWPSSNALCELARSLGFDATRLVGHMRDLGVINHASLRVRVDGRDWLVDTSMLHGEPLPLDGNVHAVGGPVFAVEIERVGDDEFVAWADVPPNSTPLPCRIFAAGVDHETYVSRYEASRERSPFNQRLYARRNRPGELLVLVGNARLSKTAARTHKRELSAEELAQALCDEIGLSQRLVDAWVRAGGLEASFQPPSGPGPPPVRGVPPSRRGRVGEPSPGGL